MTDGILRPSVREGVELYLDAIHGIAESKAVPYLNVEEDERRFAQRMVELEMLSRMPEGVTKDDVDRVINAILGLHESIDAVQSAVIRN